jgi:hypothetical protein
MGLGDAEDLMSNYNLFWYQYNKLKGVIYGIKKEIVGQWSL